MEDYVTGDNVSFPEYAMFKGNASRFLRNYTFGDMSSNSSNLDIDKVLASLLGARRKDLASVIILTIVYCLIFLSGVIGNISTCIVIARNSYMHTVTNYYLFSLAVSDLLTLLLALPPELYTIWEAYPWPFGEPFCIFKSFLMELTAYASILTITAFTCERYVAIVHPMRGQKVSVLSRAVKVIVFIWILAGICALPYPIHTRIYHFVTDPRTNQPISDSLLCNIPYEWFSKMTYVFQISTFVFFVIPMTIITVMYILIGVKLRQKETITSNVNNPLVGKTAASRARRAVLKMLVAVVVAFFVCFAPFHAQRLMTLYVKREQWTPELLTVQSYIFYVSGVLYFLSCTLNPILYNMLSRKYRQAFKRTLCRCCINLHSLPAFYKLKAKFIGKDVGGTSSPLEEKILGVQPAKAIRLTKFSHQELRKNNGIQELGYPSTKETSMRPSCSESTSGSAHAHSDGRLQQLCRHKYCSSHRARYSTLENSSWCKNQFISYPEIVNVAKGNNSPDKSNYIRSSNDEQNDGKCDKYSYNSKYIFAL